MVYGYGLDNLSINLIKEKYEIHHNVKISDVIVQSCVELSQRYITDRFLPDKAIDVMDEVCSRKRLNDLIIPKSILNLEKKIAKVHKEKETAIQYVFFASNVFPVKIRLE